MSSLAPLDAFPRPDLAAWRARAGEGVDLATEAPTDAPLGRRWSRGWTIGAQVADDAQAQRALADGAEELVWTARPAEPSPVDVGVYHRAGASAVQELAFLVATLVDRAADAPPLAFEVGRHVWDEIAKLRAARVLWHKTLVAQGVADPPPARLTATTAWRTLTAREPMTNVLRATTQTFAAVLGGADVVVVRPHEDTDAARRLALHAQLVLRHEAQLDRVADPVGGSYLVERRTDELARAAWEEARAIVAAGGMTRALAEGGVRAACDASWAAWSAQLRAGAAHLLGVDLHPDPDAARAAGLVEPAPVEGFPARRDEEVLA